VREGKARVESTLGRLGKIPLGGTAVGTGMNSRTPLIPDPPSI